MNQIQLRVALFALAHILRGRAQFVTAQAKAGSRPRNLNHPAARERAPSRIAGREEQAERMRDQARQITQMAHAEDYRNLHVAADFVGLACAHVCDDWTHMAELRLMITEITAIDGPLAAAVRQLRQLRVLPKEKEAVHG